MIPLALSPIRSQTEQVYTHTMSRRIECLVSKEVKNFGRDYTHYSLQYDASRAFHVLVPHWLIYTGASAPTGARVQWSPRRVWPRRTALADKLQPGQTLARHGVQISGYWVLCRRENTRRVRILSSILARMFTPCYAIIHCFTANPAPC